MNSQQIEKTFILIRNPFRQKERGAHGPEVKKKRPVGAGRSSDLPGARTQDPILKRDVLYLLS